MIRIAITFTALVSLAAPAFAQTNVDSAAPAAKGDSVTVVPAPTTNTNLPGVTDTDTTGSTGEAAQEGRCELPGTFSNTNPTADVPSVKGADPTCR